MHRQYAEGRRTLRMTVILLCYILKKRYLTITSVSAHSLLQHFRAQSLVKYRSSAICLLTADSRVATVAQKTMHPPIR